MAKTWRQTRSAKPEVVRNAVDWLWDVFDLRVQMGGRDRLVAELAEHAKVVEEGEKLVTDLEAHRTWFFGRYVPTWNRLFGAFVKMCPACGRRFRPQGDGRDRFCSDTCSARVRGRGRQTKAARDARLSRELRGCSACRSQRRLCAAHEAKLGLKPSALRERLTSTGAADALPLRKTRRR